MSIRLLVFDFDGTLTDIEAEGTQYERAYTRAVLSLFGEHRAAAWRAAQAAVLADAPELGWNMAGGATAPGDADPYISGTLALSRFARSEALPVLGSEDPRHADLLGALGGALYQQAYASLTPTFRPETKRVIEAAFAAVPHVRIVTNSSTAKVTEKMRHLGLDRCPTVDGDARKFEVSEPTADPAGMAALEAEWRVPSLRRAVLPRRGRYFDVLRRVWAETGTTPAETLVVGDIVELDLVLPGLLGARVHFVERPRAHAYEGELLARFGDRAARSPTLEGVLPRLG
jgi:FMN phosphatase YigB (HAD superfamily)